ncbi:helix-turn-helix domain-containing protein [Clostridioides difficile]
MIISLKSVYSKGVFLCLKNIKKYNKELKLKALINLYIKKGYSSYKIAEMLNIRSKTQVQNWVKDYKNKGKTAFNEGN